jgi:type I site-specific restriction endonuclease
LRAPARVAGERRWPALCRLAPEQEMPMSQPSKDLKEEFENSKRLLKTLRDEILLKLHLASMDAKDAWTQLSHEIKQVSHEVTESSLSTLRTLNDKLREFSESLETQNKQKQGPTSHA